MKETKYITPMKEAKVKMEGVKFDPNIDPSRKKRMIEIFKLDKSKLAIRTVNCAQSNEKNLIFLRRK